MKNIIYLSTIAILALFLESCDENSFSQVVTIDVPEHDPRPVLNLEIEAGQESTLVAVVTNSKGILDPESTYQIPTDAEVVLYRNGEVYADFEFSEFDQRYFAVLTGPFSNQPGDTYLLEAKWPAFELVQVSQEMPVIPKIKNATYESQGTIDPSGFRVDELIVDIIDQEPDRTNYYGLDLFQVYYNIDPFTGDTINSFRNKIGIDTNDPLLSYGARYSLIFNDDSFSGGEYQVRCYTYYSIGEDSELEVHLYQLSEDAFLYARSYEQYQNAIGNPFAEPVTVHSNIPNGYGIFSLVNKDVYRIEN